MNITPFLLITKPKAVRAILLLLYMIPIGMLSRKFYFHLHTQDSIKHHMYAILFFGFVFVICYELETVILPMICSIIYNKTSHKEFKRPISIANRVISRFDFNVNLDQAISINKMEYYKMIIEVDFLFVLWIIYFNNIYCYLLLVPIVYFTHILLKAITIIYSYSSELNKNK